MVAFCMSTDIIETNIDLTSVQHTVNLETVCESIGVYSVVQPDSVLTS